MKRHLWILLIATLLIGCTKEKKEEDSAQTSDDKQPVAYASNYPLMYFADRIAAPMIEVHLAPPSGIDPAFWKPLAEDIQAMQKADLILLNGASYESWLATVSLPTSRLLDTSLPFRGDLIPLQQNETHSHGPAGEHAHTGTAFTTWLDLNLSIQQAETILDACITRWPEHKSRFTKQFEQLRQDLEILDREFKLAVAANPEQPVLFSHPVYQYAERRYEMNGHSLHWEPGERPSEQSWNQLRQILTSHPAKWMIWEAQPLAETIQGLQALGIQSIVYTPCATNPEQGDFLSAAQRNADNLRKVYGGQVR